MTIAVSGLLSRLLLFFFTLFVIATTFSIALAQTMLGISLLLYIVVCVREQHNPFVREFKWLWWLIGAFVFWLALSSCFAKDPLHSLKNLKDEWLFAAIPITLFVARNDQGRRRLLSAFAIAVGCISLYALVQAVTGMSWFKFADGRLTSVPILDVQGNFNNCMTFGNYVVTAGCFLLGIGLSVKRESGLKPWLFTVSGVLAIVATFLTLRRGAIAAAIMTLLLFAVLLNSRKRWLLVSFAALIAAVVLFSPEMNRRFGSKSVTDLSTSHSGSRVYIWVRSFDMIKEHPIFGVGLANFYEEYVSRLPVDVPQARKLGHAHNDYIHVAAIAGIPALLAFVGIWLAVFHFFWRSYRDGEPMGLDRALSLAALLGSVAFMATSMIEATFADEEVRQMLMFVWAIGLTGWYNWRSDVQTA